MQSGEAIHRTIKGGIFNKDFLQQIISAPNCAGVRYYFARVLGSDVAAEQADAGTDIPTIVLIAVDEAGNDILTADNAGNLLFGGDNSWPCSPHCGSASALNTI